MAGASPSPLGHAMRSSAPPWGQRSQDAMMTQTLYA